MTFASFLLSRWRFLMEDCEHVHACTPTRHPEVYSSRSLLFFAGVSALPCSLRCQHSINKYAEKPKKNSFFFFFNHRAPLLSARVPSPKSRSHAAPPLLRIMKTACAFAIVTMGCAHAFVMPAAHSVVRPQTARAAEKINTIEFEKDSPKVGCVVDLANMHDTTFPCDHAGPHK